MNCDDILSQHQELQSIIFRLEYRGVKVEAVLACLLPGGLAAEITAPQQLAGLKASCCHIPYFAYPNLRGYVWRGALTAKALECLRRVLALRVDGHLFLQAHGAEVRRLFKKVASDVYRQTAQKEPGLYDYATFTRLRTPLLQRYKSGQISQKEYQQALRKLKQPLERHDEINWKIEQRFHEQILAKYPNQNAKVRISDLFRKYHS